MVRVRGIKRLTRLGLLVTRPGHGTFVTQKIDPFVSLLTVQVDKVGIGEGATYQSQPRGCWSPRAHRNQFIVNTGDVRATRDESP